MRLAPGGDAAILPELSVRRDFDESFIGFLQWAPERTLIRVNREVSDALLD